MKWTFCATVICVTAATLASAAEDPCRDKQSNADIRECYWKEQGRVNAEADSLANGIAMRLYKEAQDPSAAGVPAELLRKAAARVIKSQQTWKIYRD
jgi:hypothetical protein